MQPRRVVVGCPRLLSPPLWLSLSIVSGLLLFTWITLDDRSGVLKWFRTVAFTIFRTRSVLYLACGLAWSAHLLEAVVAYRICTQLGGGKNTWKWTIQTFCIGFPSLRLLQAEQRKRVA